MASKESGSLFQWQATMFNLSAFISVSLFCFISAVWFRIVPVQASQIRYFLLTFLIVIASVTIRHIVCTMVGSISGEREVFGEYLFWVYQVYRLASVFLLALSTLILYTGAFSPGSLFYIGFVLIALFYLLRISRLFLIFINRRISILYLILYLCALEILPVAMIIKFATGVL